MLKRVVIVIFLGLAFLIGALVANTLRFTSRQVSVEPAPPLEFDVDAAAKRLAQAVRFRTVSHQDPALFDSAAFLQLHEFLASAFPLVHQNLTREIVRDYSLFYTWPGTEPDLKPIVLLAHQDVVPVVPGTEESWEHDAFSGAVSDGFVWGRGTLDDKVNVMAALEAVETLLAAGAQPKRTVYLAFGHDEELASSPSGAMEMAALLEERGVDAEFVLDEGGAIISDVFPGLPAPVATVGVSEKGYTTLELIVQGAGGHSSQPTKETPIGILAAAVDKLEKNQMPAYISGPTLDMLQNVGRESAFTTKLVMANLWLFGPVLTQQLGNAPSTNAMIRTTTAPTIIEAGVKENVLPTRARAVVNFRIHPLDTIDSVVEHVRTTINDPRVEIGFVTKGSDPAPVSPSDGPAFDVVERTIRETVPGTIVTPYVVIAATDARHYQGVSDNVYRFSPLRLGSEDLPRIHGINERIGIENYGEIVSFYHRLIENSAL